MLPENIKNKSKLIYSIIIEFFKDNKKQIFYAILILVLILSIYIRTLNVSSLEGKYPLELDPFLFLRYTKEIAEKGTLDEIDHMRYAPIGYNTSGENTLLSYVMVYLYKFIKLFNPNTTIEQAVFIYPVIAFALTLLVFFFLVKKLFDDKTALVSTTLLGITPSITLYRTMYGFADKEALGLLLMILSFYFYITGLQKEKTKSKLIYGSLAGISTGILVFIWGGFQFVLIIISTFILIELLTERIKLENYYVHLTWSLFTLIMLITSKKHTFVGTLKSTPIFSLLLLVTLAFTVYYLILKFKPKIKNKLEQYLPTSFLSLIISICLGGLGGSIILGSSFLVNQTKSIISRITNPIGTSTLIQTISEAETSTINDWLKYHNYSLFLFIIGAIILFYIMIKDLNYEFKSKKSFLKSNQHQKLTKSLKKHKLYLTFIFALLILGIIFTRLNNDEILNGSTLISQILYILPMVIFIIYALTIYIYGFYKDKDLIKEIQKINQKYIFIFTWLIISLIAARGAVRLFIIATPVICLTISFLINQIYNFTINTNEKLFKKIGIFILIAILIFPSNVFSTNTKGSFLSLIYKSKEIAENSKPQFDIQWQLAISWLKETTPKNSVIASWWDYGYWIQTAGNRSTVLDGGNAIGYWNYLMARQVLTSNNSIEALEFLKTHNVTHLIISGDDINKYHAISRIGSDNDDRLNNFKPILVVPQYSKKSGNNILFYFSNIITLDEDLNFKNKVYLKDKAQIESIILSATITNDGINFQQPKATISMGAQTDTVPLECLIYKKKEIKYNEPGLKGCLMIVDYADEKGKDPNIKSGIYISPKSRNTLFTELYLFENEVEDFNLIYSSPEYNKQITFYVPQSLFLGPIKIWEITYPENIKPNEKYLLKEDPTGRIH